jgi:hypothetical protein
MAPVSALLNSMDARGPVSSPSPQARRLPPMARPLILPPMASSTFSCCRASLLAGASACRAHGRGFLPTRADFFSPARSLAARALLARHGRAGSLHAAWPHRPPGRGRLWPWPPSRPGFWCTSLFPNSADRRRSLPVTFGRVGRGCCLQHTSRLPGLARAMALVAALSRLPGLLCRVQSWSWLSAEPSSRLVAPDSWSSPAFPCAVADAVARPLCLVELFYCAREVLCPQRCVELPRRSQFHRIVDLAKRVRRLALCRLASQPCSLPHALVPDTARAVFGSRRLAPPSLFLSGRDKILSHQVIGRCSQLTMEFAVLAYF